MTRKLLNETLGNIAWVHLGMLIASQKECDCKLCQAVDKYTEEEIDDIMFDDWAKENDFDPKKVWVPE